MAMQHNQECSHRCRLGGCQKMEFKN